MYSKQQLLLFSILFISILTLGQTVNGSPASSFNLQDGDWFDNFGIDRNYYAGSNGYLPNLATETLNENKELAYSIGESFLAEYPSENERAVAILKYVQQWTEYGYDSDNVFRDGVAQEEWAWNADEMAHAFNQVTGVTAVGDCEDMAFLCGTIYIGAGFDVAIIDAPDHVALLIWLPEFSNANSYWDLLNDNRDAGWIWVEATGSSNPLGWTPPDYQDGGWTAYSIGSLEFVSDPLPTQDTSSTINLDLLVIIGFILLFVVLALLRVRRR